MSEKEIDLFLHGTGGVPPLTKKERQPKEIDLYAYGTGGVKAEDVAFDPGAHTVADVVAYLDQADEAEVERVLAAEEAGEARSGVLES